VLYHTLCECGECGCNCECQCECYFDIQHADMKLGSLFEECQSIQLHMALCCTTQLIQLHIAVCCATQSAAVQLCAVLRCQCDCCLYIVCCGLAIGLIVCILCVVGWLLD
jgi:hypothetical protein